MVTVTVNAPRCNFGVKCTGGLAAGEGLRGLRPVNPQLDSKMSSSTQPSHPNSPSPAEHGVFAAELSVRCRNRSHSRNPDKIEPLVAG